MIYCQKNKKKDNRDDGSDNTDTDDCAAAGRHMHILDQAFCSMPEMRSQDGAAYLQHSGEVHRQRRYRIYGSGPYKADLLCMRL